MKAKQLWKRILCVSRVWLSLEEREIQQLQTEAKSRNGRSAGHTAKQLLFILAVLCITGVPAFAVTDILFLVDTTGSMGSVDSVKATLEGIIDAIETDSCPESILFGVADYRNRIDGLNYEAYGVNLVQPFTDSTEDVLLAINGLGGGNGGDGPESQLKAMVSIADNWLTTSGDLDFHGRAEAQKIIIWAGDQPGHDEADDSYYPSVNAVINSLTAQGIMVFALNPSGLHEGLDDEYNGHYQASEITDATGGELFNSVSSATTAITDAIIDEIICFTFEKDDDLDDENPSDCRQEGQEIEYTISWTNTSGQPLTNAWILDKLPAGVSYPISYTLDPNTWEMIPSDPNYDSENHEYVWFIGQIPVDASGSVSLTVVVNSNAVPGMNLINTAELYDGESLVTIATKKTLICCPENPISTIYVDKFATGANSGLNWENAYNSLDDALTQARESVCVTNFTILVAQGTYAPINATNGFVLPSGCSVFGGYPIGGGDVASPKKYETILTGLIDEDEFPDATKIVTMGNGSSLEGVTVTKARFTGYGVYGNGVSFTLSHCVVKENFGFGIYSTNCDTEIRRTTVSNNGRDGLSHQGEGRDLKVDTSWLLRNGAYGIYCNGSTPTIRSSIISESSMTEQGRQAIHIKNPKYQPKLYNLTLANNRAAGLHFEDDGDITGDPNFPDYPDLQNSIIFFNGDSQISGFNPDVHANFCCIQDCNEPIGTTNFNAEPGFAYTVDPNGMPDPNNYHLSATSICIDRANPDPAMGYDLQVDYDNELRQYGDAVDVGADEVYNCNDEYLSQADVFNERDFDADGMVGLTEFAMFSKSWMTFDPNHPYCDPNNPNYVSDPNAPGYIDADDKLRFNPVCDLDEDLHVGLSDLILFLDDWTWIACWKLEEINAMLAMQSQSQSLSMITESPTVENTEATMIFAENSGVAATESIEVDGQTVGVEPPVIEEKSLAEQIADLQDSIEFLEQIWLEEPDIQQEIDAEEWQEFMDSVRNSLLGLQTEDVQIE